MDASPGFPLDSMDYRGEVVYFFAFDIAYEMTRARIPTLMGQPVSEFVLDPSKRTPRLLFPHRSQMVRLPVQELTLPHGKVNVERTVKLLPAGGLSIGVRVPFTAVRLRDLVAYHDLAIAGGSIGDEARKLAQEVCRELRPFLVRPHEQLSGDEAYTVFCLKSPLIDGSRGALRAADWFAAHRSEVAALLTEEPEPERLSQQEAEESTALHLSYYGHDLVVVDWDAALLLDEPGNFPESLHLMELANLQLAELQAYDRLLDDSLEQAYRDMRSRSFHSRIAMLRDLRELRIDLTRLSDELSNTTKFFGDWHLARLYAALSSRFHLSDWHRSIDEKLQALGELYGLLAQDRTNRLMLILEVTIVLLFIFDIVMLIWRGR